MSTDEEYVLPVKDVFDEWVEQEAEVRGPDGCFHPSSLWMCDRQAVMQARGEHQTQPPNKGTMRVFKIGHLLHAEIQAALIAKYGDNFQPEFSITGDLLAGHGDGLLKVPASDPVEYDLYEFKSTKAISRIKKENAPQESHVKQAATYAVSKTREGIKIRNVRIVYFEKRDLEIVEFVIPYRPQWEKMVDDKIDELAPYIDGRKEDQYPACTGPKWMRNYCAFYPSCDRATKDGKFATISDAAAAIKTNEFSW